MRGRPTCLGDDGYGLEHGRDVLGGSHAAYEHYVLPVGGARLGLVSVSHGDAGCHSGADAGAASDHGRGGVHRSRLREASDVLVR